MIKLPRFRRQVVRVALCAAILHVAQPAVAQNRAFVAAGSGQIGTSEKMTGEIEDLNNGLVYVRVSLHDQRRVPLNDIWFMNFQPKDEFYWEEVRDAAGPEHLLVLRNGQKLKGYVANIEGGPASSKPDEEQVITLRSAYGERRFPLREVLRIYIRDIPMPAPAPAAKRADPVVTPPVQLPGSIPVPANVRWVSTNVYVQRGQQVTFRASGQVQLSADANDLASPAGSVTERRAMNAPVPEVLAGALIGRVGAGTVFAIGNQTGPLSMPAAGELFLGVNDDTLDDNRGAFQVVVTPVMP